MAFVGIVLLIAGVVVAVFLTLAGPFLLSRFRRDDRARPRTVRDD